MPQTGPVTTMTRDEILEKIRDILVDALAVDEDEVVPSATLTGDLGAESIDILDITFKLEQEFGFKIAQGELFPESMMQDEEYVQDGKFTPKGIDMLKQRVPHFDFELLERDPSVENMRKILTVEALIRFCDHKLQAA